MATNSIAKRLAALEKSVGAREYPQWVYERQARWKAYQAEKDAAASAYAALSTEGKIAHKRAELAEMDAAFVENRPHDGIDLAALRKLIGSDISKRDHTGPPVPNAETLTEQLRRHLRNRAPVEGSDQSAPDLSADKSRLWTGTCPDLHDIYTSNIELDILELEGASREHIAAAREWAQRRFWKHTTTPEAERRGNALKARADWKKWHCQKLSDMTTLLPSAGPRDRAVADADVVVRPRRRLKALTSEPEDKIAPYRGRPDWYGSYEPDVL